MPEMMTQNEMMTKYLDRLLDSAEEDYEEAKAEFIRRASSNPADAIAWGEGMVKEQAKYEAAATIRRYETKLINDFREEARFDEDVELDHADKLNLLIDAIEAYVERTREELIRGRFLPTSTSMLSNGVGVAKHDSLGYFVNNLADNVRAARERMES